MTMQSTPIPRKRVKMTPATSKLGGGKFFLVESSDDPGDCWECPTCEKVNQPEEQVCSCCKA